MLLVFRHHFAHSCSKSILFSIKDPNVIKITCLNTSYYHSLVYPFRYSCRKSFSWPSNSRLNLAHTQFSLVSVKPFLPVNLYSSSAPGWLRCIKGPNFTKITCLNTSYYHSYVYPFRFSSRKSFSWLSNSRLFLAHSQFSIVSVKPFLPVNFYSSSAPGWLRGPPSRSLRKRMNRRARIAAMPVLDESQFQKAVSQIPPRFTPEELRDVMISQKDPLVCFELFNWALKQHRFRHNVSTFHVVIQRLGEGNMYKEMDDIVNQVLAIPSIGSEELFNSMIYYFTEARKLTRAVMIYKHMLNSRKLDCRPTIRTYNILFKALLSRRNNSYINHMYMEAIRSLFKQMIDNQIEPDIVALNTLIKGYVLSLHVNDALRIFHQMGVVYECQPNSFSYDYLIHGLCAQGRTKNAKEIYDKMKCKGLVPSSKSYNSLVNSLALGGEVDEAVKFLWEMNGNRRTIDFITFKTVIDEVCRQRSVKDAIGLLKELQDKELVDGLTHNKLLSELEDDIDNLNIRNH
ncbi:pentatricopeptide repeat-containing protein At2g27800, mitochondrial-like [Lycium ferocissimum]|uniref:pentatricopeptide repeat-containing protein At2g27800, mitochondrial-like n=1 Tax=Lycium ferocissimum TaxID=112874 RepID=UPI002815B2A0|nr:pentatricopeptide repeat-containing protein At2g27800, mitochondrial-like [Lycium ferocissimum]XP_059279614.1 pentatricopeptide repeat-containing protein At2g27800, mitochondrial-like [Lycium ferocissimum]XP_059279615.1 pentatricopeptide repeat-containing protein At2g27800, mitochondrial-like [Lycium ferocissimum]XP_059279616.1 pentatricopeptide repeat-containing protein At2g27800, mitochondrial-like [Lycium ferocissimum]